MAPTMQLPELTNYINGGTSTPTVDRNNSLRNANTAEPLQAQLSCDSEQVEEALQAADAAYQKGEWEHTPAAERADILITLVVDDKQTDQHDRKSAPDLPTLRPGFGHLRADVRCRLRVEPRPWFLGR